MKKSSIENDKIDNLLVENNHEVITSKPKKKKNLYKTAATIILSRKVRWFIFIVMIFIQLLMNLDHGSIPAATDAIREDLEINDKILGTFGSLVFAGNLIGN
jgi:hypothetical protein